MYIQRLKSLMAAQRLRPADVARAAHISRAAVSKWFCQGQTSDWVNVETTSVRQLAATLGVTISDFLEPLQPIAHLQTQFLWDALYPSMEHFVSALIRKEPEAMARLVQVVGFHDARVIVGDIIISRFTQYQHCIHPARREQLERVWPLYQSKT